MSSEMFARARSYAWIVLAHAIGGIVIGCFEAIRLGNTPLGFALVPIFAATGLATGAILAALERALAGRREWLVAIGVAAPSLLVTLPVGATLFRGAYAQTLPLASVLPYVVPLFGWLGIAVL